MDLSVSSSMSFGVVCVACASRSSLCSMVVNRLWFLSSMKFMASCCCVNKCFCVEFVCVCVSIMLCVFFCLHVERGLQVGSHCFQVFNRGPAILAFFGSGCLLNRAAVPDVELGRGGVFCLRV